MCSAGDLALVVEAGDELALRDRVVAAVQHVLLARPDELHRRARHLLRDRDRLAHPVVHGAATAEAAAERQLVDLALRLRQPGGLGRRRPAPPRRSASASTPRSAPASSAPSRSSAPSSRGSGAGRRRPPRASAAPRRSRPARRPTWLPTTASLASRPAASTFANSARRRLGVRAVVPLDRQRVERGLRAPPGVGDDGDRGVADAHDLLHAGSLHHRGRVDALHLAAEHRAVA